jgi:hypothetical protein
MIAVNWADVGCPTEAGEREVAGLVVMIQWDHIARWREDPDGIWEVQEVKASQADREPPYTLDQWHPTDDHELRRSPRIPVQIGARAQFSRTASEVECVICDLSATGAGLTLPDGTLLPATFILERLDTGERHTSRLRWSRGRRCGVSFET